MNYSTKLKNRLSANAIKLCSTKSFTGIERQSAFLFDDIAMSFHPDTYRNIINNKNYVERIKKIHPKVPSILEMQSSNSSDALLMNFFAHPKIKEWKGVRDLVSISSSDDIEFGWNPVHENENNYKTEIDIRIGNSIIEAKLTEEDFKSKKLNVVLRYLDVEKIVDLQVLTKNDIVSNYQLIRNLITARKYGYKFTLLIDASRIDLLREFYKVKGAIIDKSFAANFNFITWQEMTNCVGDDLKNYITEKYL